MDQEKMSQNLEDILEIVLFLKENMASKDDLREAKEEMNDNLQKTEETMINHVDAFVGMHQKLDLELTALRSKVNRLEEQLQALQLQVQGSPA